VGRDRAGLRRKRHEHDAGPDHQPGGAATKTSAKAVNRQDTLSE
jgi:hypothetical protein